MAKKELPLPPIEEAFYDDEELALPTPKKKSKKKKNKKKKNKTLPTVERNSDSQIALHSSQSPKVRNRKVEQAIQETLPPHVSSWEIIPNAFNNGETQLLILYVNGVSVTHIEITVDNMEELLDALNSTIITNTEVEVTGWSIREPEDKELPPIFSLISHGAVIGTMPLDQEVAKEIVPKFLKIYNPHKPTFERLLIWIFRHKILATLIGLALLTLIVYPFISSAMFSV